jgi:hypothetical protein
MRRHLRVLAIAGALASSFLLSACDKPAPKITVQSGAYSATITPSTYCFDTDPNHCHNFPLDLPVVSARADDTILIDVPSEVVDNGWSITALATPSLIKVGQVTKVKHRHSYRLIASANGAKPFVVQVAQLHNGTPDGSTWSFLVNVSTRP